MIGGKQTGTGVISKAATLIATAHGYNHQKANMVDHSTKDTTPKRRNMVVSRLYFHRAN